MIRMRTTGRSGFTLVEALIAGTVLSVVLLTAYGMLQHDAQISRSTLGISIAETRCQAMITELERELADARGASPIAVQTGALVPAGTQVNVGSTLGFPPSGMLLVDRGSAAVERMRYDALDATRFLSLTRGQQCTTAASHATATEILWGGLAQPIELQVNPAPSLFDGRARVAGRTIFFRGDGTGFSYRVPTDPAGGRDFIDGDELRWGATVRGTPTLDGWYAIVFEPRETITEASSGTDMNNDGDRLDTFDIGQLRRRAWNATNPAGLGDDLGLGPTVLIQERCRHGRDLDGDGFDDPMFLWDAERRQLSIRLFVVGHADRSQPIVRKLETTIFLRNVAEG